MMIATQRAKKLAAIRGEHTLIVGVDIAKFKHWGVIMDARTEMALGKPFAFENTKEGFASLVLHITKARKSTGATQVIVAMEPSGHYWKPLASFLQRMGFKVVTVNPYHVKKAKEFDDNSPTKNDRKDAWVIARRVSDADFFDPYLPEGIYAELRSLTQARQQNRVKLNQALNQLRAFLDEFFPEFASVFADPLGLAASYLLRYHPLPVDVMQFSAEELASELQAVSSRRVGLKRAQQLQDAARASIGVQTGLDAARLRLRLCLAEIEFLHNQQQVIEAAMADALERTGLAPYLLSVPGIGVVTAASLLGETGDLGRYDDWRQVRKLAGYNLAENSSGEHQSKSYITKRGRPGLRCLLYQAAAILAAKNAQFKALYHHFRTREQNPLRGKQALVAIACKLLRVVFTLARERQYYDPTKVLGEFRTNQLDLAA